MKENVYTTSNYFFDIIALSFVALTSMGLGFVYQVEGEFHPYLQSAASAIYGALVMREIIEVWKEAKP